MELWRLLLLVGLALEAWLVSAGSIPRPPIHLTGTTSVPAEAGPQISARLPAAALCAALASALLALIWWRQTVAARGHGLQPTYSKISGRTARERGLIPGQVNSHAVQHSAERAKGQRHGWLHLYKASDGLNHNQTASTRCALEDLPSSCHSVTDSPLFADSLLSSEATCCSPRSGETSLWSYYMPSYGRNNAAQKCVSGCARLLSKSRAPYVSRLGAQTVHIKVPFIEPEDLPADFLQKIQAGLQSHTEGHCTVVGGAVRRGCVELALDILATRRAAMAEPQKPINPDSGVSCATDTTTGDAYALTDGGMGPASGAGKARRASAAGCALQGATSGGGGGAGAGGGDEGDGSQDNDNTMIGELADAGLNDLTPLDWVHWLYLQPPAEAEVLVQACGRAFITCWDAERQHWLTHEMPSVDSLGNRLPDSLPRVSHVEPPCLVLGGQSAGVGAGISRAASNVSMPAWLTPITASSSPPVQPLRLLLVGRNLHQPHTSVAARFLGAYLSVESRPVHGRHASNNSSGSSSSRAQIQSGSGQHEPVWLDQLEDGLQVLELLVHGVMRPGLLQLEGWCSRLLAWRWQVAVVDSPAVANELSQHFGKAGLQPLLLPAQPLPFLLTGGDGDGAEGKGTSSAAAVVLAATARADQLKVDDLMTDLGCWLEFSAGMQALGLKLPGGSSTEATGPGSAGGRGASWSRAASGSLDSLAQSFGTNRQLQLPIPADVSLPQLSDALMQACRSAAYQEQMVDTAVQLLGYSCGTAWPATAGMLLEGLLRLGLTWRAVRDLTTQQSLTLLHRAVCSGSPSMVQLVAGWGDAHGVPWQWSEADPGSGITPLHLAAVLPVGGIAGGSSQLHLEQLLLASSNSSGLGTAAAAVDTVGSDSLADWILAEFEAACRFWHGATDVQGVTPAEVLVAVNRSPTASMSVNLEAHCTMHPRSVLRRLGTWPQSHSEVRQRSNKGGSAAGTGDREASLGRRRHRTSQHAVVKGWIDKSAKVSKEDPAGLTWSKEGEWALDGGPDPCAAIVDNDRHSSSTIPSHAGSGHPSGSDLLTPGGLLGDGVGAWAASRALLSGEIRPGSGTCSPSLSLLLDSTCTVSGAAPADTAPAAAASPPAQAAAAKPSISNSDAKQAAASGRVQEVDPFPAVADRSGMSKQASRLEAELQLVQSALVPHALLKASVMHFTSRKLEAAFVSWLANKRQRLRQLIPGLMSCVVSVALALELQQGTDPRGPLTFLAFAVPWVVLLWHARGVPKKSARPGKMYAEEAWVAIILWHLLVRGLQAADVLHVPVSVRTFVYRGGDTLSEGGVQAFFLVRTQRMALLRVLYALSATALYLRGGVPIASALTMAALGNLACLIASWFLDLINRKHFLQHLTATIEQHQRQEQQQRVEQKHQRQQQQLEQQKREERQQRLKLQHQEEEGAVASRLLASFGGSIHGPSSRLGGRA